MKWGLILLLLLPLASAHQVLYDNYPYAHHPAVYNYNPYTNTYNYYWRQHDLQAHMHPRVIYEEVDEESYHEYVHDSLDVKYGSFEYFNAGHRAASNYEIAFNKGFNDGFYGKKTYFDDDHEMTTWYREAYYNGYYAGVEDRLRRDYPG